jgi:hypothetical protein
LSWILDSRAKSKNNGNAKGTCNRNDKSEMRGSLHFGGKCAAFGRDDASWVALNPLNTNNDGNNKRRQTQQQRNKRNSNETKATTTKQRRQQRNKGDSYETNATATKQTQQHETNATAAILHGEAVRDDLISSGREILACFWLAVE